MGATIEAVDGSVVVAALETGSPLVAAGVTAGSRLVAINGEDTTTMVKDELIALFAQTEDLQTLRFAVDVTSDKVQECTLRV